jgi:hypothetical protein
MMKLGEHKFRWLLAHVDRLFRIARGAGYEQGVKNIDTLVQINRVLKGSGA